jgi:hypothetical protein
MRQPTEAHRSVIANPDDTYYILTYLTSWLRLLLLQIADVELFGRLLCWRQCWYPLLERYMSGLDCLLPGDLYLAGSHHQLLVGAGDLAL